MSLFFFSSEHHFVVLDVFSDELYNFIVHRLLSSNDEDRFARVGGSFHHIVSGMKVLAATATATTAAARRCKQRLVLPMSSTWINYAAQVSCHIFTLLARQNS